MNEELIEMSRGLIETNRELIEMNRELIDMSQNIFSMKQQIAIIVFTAIMTVFVEKLVQGLTIRDIWKKLCKMADDFLSMIDIPRRVLARRITNKDFLKWQDAMLLKIYKEDKYFTTILGTKYPVFRMDFDKDYEKEKEIDNLCELLYADRNTMSDKYDKIMNEYVAVDVQAMAEEKALKKKLMGNGWYWKGYQWFMKRSMQDGNHVGYILDYLDLDNDNRIKKIHLSVGNYKLNLLTSHIMTYEFFKAYHKLPKDKRYSIELEELWPMLPFRHYIHKVNDFKIENVLSKGWGRFALLSVQCLVILCTERNNGTIKYKCFLGKRSKSTRSVSTKLGCFQFPPSGGFDLYDDENGASEEIIRDNCSLTIALMREYLEEIFGDKDFSRFNVQNENGAGVSIDGLIRNDPRVDSIKKKLQTPLNDKNYYKENTQKAYFTTVGANVDLIDLRLSVNFLLVINDVSYYIENRTKFQYNDELTDQNFFMKLFNKKNNKMLNSWSTIDDMLRNHRNIVEDSVALYAQGKKAFRKYLESVLVNQSLIGQICNDMIDDNSINEEVKSN